MFTCIYKAHIHVFVYLHLHIHMYSQVTLPFNGLIYRTFSKRKTHFLYYHIKLHEISDVILHRDKITSEICCAGY